MWELAHEEGWALKNWCFQTVFLEKTLESPLDSKQIKAINPKGINLEYSLEGLMLKLKFWYFGHLMWRANSLEKNSDAGKDWGQEKGTTEDEMAGWHHRLNGHEFEQALGVADGQGSLVSCSSQCCKELDMTEWLKKKKTMFGFVGNCQTIFQNVCTILLSHQQWAQIDAALYPCY